MSSVSIAARARPRCFHFRAFRGERRLADRARSPFASFSSSAGAASTKSRTFGEEASSAYPKLGAYAPAAVAGERDGMTRYPSIASFPGLLRGCDYFGTWIFAASGSVTAASCGMDLLGATAIGTITAVGGGTVRDAIILHKQPFWVEEAEYFYMAAAVAAATFFAWPQMPAGNAIKNEKGGEGPFMFWGDAVGVGTFAVVGAMNAFRACVHPGLAVLCGTVTATFGGLTRDVICGIPSSGSRGRIFHSKADLYATTAAGGASVYALLRQLRAPLSARILGGVASAVALRWAANEFAIGLPTWNDMRWKVDGSDLGNDEASK